MPWTNHASGYGRVSKTLHWLTVALLLTQFTVGYLMDADESGRGRGRGRGGESGRGRGRGGDSLDLDDPLVRLHVAIGVTVLVVAVLRVLWRRAVSLPPWSPVLSAGERRFATTTERALLTLLFVVPLTGLVLVVGGDDDLVGLHVASHVAFFVALAAHLGLVLRHTVVRRDGLLRRML